VSLTGSLSDVPVVDLIQFVHASGRSGTLYVEREGAAAYVSFHRGRIVSAYSPASPGVARLLVDSGALAPDALAQAERAQPREEPPQPLGQRLVASGAITHDQLREAITHKIVRTIDDLLGWTRGEFRFAVDEVRGDGEISLAPGDVIPELDLNTQMIILEALRLFDEREQARATDALEPVGDAPAPDANADVWPTPPGPRQANDPAPVAPPLASVHVVSPHAPLCDALAVALRDRAPVRRVRLLDAGVRGPGEQPPVVVLDLRGGLVPASAIRRVRSRHPRAVVIALAEPHDDAAALYTDGAAAVLPAVADTVAACCATLLGTRGAGPGVSPEDDLRGGLARLRRILGELRTGLMSATMSLHLMSIVADSVERAVLFAARGGAFVAIGAFGSREDGQVLAATTRGMTLRPSGESPLQRCLADGHARLVDTTTDRDLPPELPVAIGRPRSGQAALFPVLGARRVIALIYADNGRRLRAIDDVELVEIATAQVGLAFENELLRRQLDRAPANGR
jgi:hypothetical protein